MTTANHILLRRITLTASASSVTFDSIPQTGYTDLKIVISSRGTRGTYENGSIGIRFNNDSSSVYNTRSLMGRGSSSYSETTGNTTFIYFNTATSTATSNVYGNTEIYIPNYTSNVAKSVSIDSVGENNSTNSILNLGAGLWNPGTQAAISRIDFIVGVWDSMSDILAGTTFSLYGVANAATTPALAPKADGGDIIKTDGTYWYHAFLASGSFTPQVNLTADILAIAGGGGGGANNAGVGGGGGGAGGLLAFTSQTLAALTAQTVTVGSGGATTAAGTNSQFGSLTAVIGGGAGGSSGVGGNGGSGGGGKGGSSGGTQTSGQGYAGGAGSGNQGGGGGGAGVAGGNATTTSGTGGNGLNTWSSWATATGTGVSGYYAGGGSGGGNPSTTAANGAAGNGGGGQGYYNTTGGAATANTGSGGGGGGYNAGAFNGGAGGSGIVIVRYAV